MPTINVISNWNVKKLSDDQAIYGTVYANGVYKFTTVKDDTQKAVVMSIKSVTPVTKEGTDEVVDYKIVPSIIFNQFGFKVADEDADTILISEIDEAEREYIKYEALGRDARPKSTDADPFEFNFINTKTSKPFRILVDHDHFVGIPAVTKRGDVHTNFGYIDHIDTDASGKVTRIVMNGIISTRGVFRGGRTVIPYEKLRGIYHYNVVIEPHKTRNAIEETSVQEAATEAAE